MLPILSCNTFLNYYCKVSSSWFTSILFCLRRHNNWKDPSTSTKEKELLIWRDWFPAQEADFLASYLPHPPCLLSYRADHSCSTLSYGTEALNLWLLVLPSQGQVCVRTMCKNCLFSGILVYQGKLVPRITGLFFCSWIPLSNF